jgi:hypothetical protein
MYRTLKALGETLVALLRRDFAFDRSTVPWRLRWTEAEEQAERLLVATLSPLQRAQYLAAGHFEVVGSHTGRRYRILRSAQMNIERLDRSGRRVELLCFIPEGSVPVGDVMLAQKFALELYELDAVNAANRYPVLREARRHWSVDGADDRRRARG